MVIIEAEVKPVALQKVAPVSPILRPRKTNTQSPGRDKGNPKASVLEKTLAFRDPVQRGGFTQVSNLVLRDSSLSSNAVRLYLLLLSYAWQDKECFPGQDRLASDMGCTKRTIINVLAGLRRRRLITWQRRGLGKTSLYTIEPLNKGYLPPQFVDKGKDA